MLTTDTSSSALPLDKILAADCLRPLVGLPWFTPPKAQVRHFNRVSADYTAIIPIFNQEAIIGRFLKDFFLHSRLPHNIVAIFDCCADESRKAFWAGIETYATAKLGSVIEVITPVPYFETACDNLGFLLADAPRVIEFQPDLILGTPGYDAKMMGVLDDPRVFSASGRCGHSLLNVYGPAAGQDLAEFQAEEAALEIGLTGRKIETDGFDVDDANDTAYFCETVNRGPLAFRLSDLKRLNYFDHANFFLGDDDHDLNLRARQDLALQAAYVPMKVRSNLSEGSTRKPRDPLNADIFAKLNARENASRLAQFKSYYIQPAKPEAFEFTSW
ncbi:hypothetical protein [Asticcacaulis sp. AND118]|uniref:hypothetical protein n=1 Tax=Asticcacaulis sp. AND118 TaxID=2840468 RepID=UPI001CFF8BFD|nr:hypothetical protein [Asticcacaulis sp. AND118]UDF03395.1 hypothetical protein LH365_13285 [Asticcacaulis sp. AND118]